MPRVPTLHAAKIGVTFAHSTENVRGELTFAVLDPTDAIFADPAAFATQVYNAVSANLVPFATPQVVFDGVVFEDVRTLPYVGADYPQGPNAGTGGPGVASLPTSCCIAVKKSTGNLGRSGRGRMYVPIWDSVYLATPDTITVATATAIVARLSAFQAAVEGGAMPVQMGVISQQHGGAPVNPGLFQRITSWGLFDVKIDSQRRRLLGRGS